MRHGMWMFLVVMTAATPVFAGEAKKGKARSPAHEGDTKAREAREAEAQESAKKATEASQVVRSFTPGTPEAAIRDIIHCGADVSDDSAAFDCWLKLQLTQNRDTETAVTQLRHYSWKVFRSRADSYALTPVETTHKEFALKITHREPEKCDAEAKQCKFFLFSHVRDSPAPITLQH